MSRSSRSKPKKSRTVKGGYRYHGPAGPDPHRFTRAFDSRAERAEEVHDDQAYAGHKLRWAADLDEVADMDERAARRPGTDTEYWERRAQQHRAEARQERAYAEEGMRTRGEGKAFLGFFRVPKRKARKVKLCSCSLRCLLRRSVGLGHAA